MFILAICNNQSYKNIHEAAKINPVLAATNAHYAYLYANDILKSSFPLGEPAIATNVYWSVEYTKNVLNGNRFELGEKIIALSDYFSYAYATILQQRFKLGEPAIANSTKYSYYYTIYVLKNPFPLGEPAIAKNSIFARDYTHHVLKHDFYLNDKLICEYKPKKKFK